MKRLAMLGALLISLMAVPRAGTLQTAGTASLGGRVVQGDAANARPVARTVITIDAGSGERVTVTNDEGRFLFEGLAPGRYLLKATKSGWVPSYYGSARPGRPPGVRIAVESGKRADVEVPIIRGSVLAGRIVDHEGRPMPRQFPWLLEQRMVGDQRMIARTRFPYSVGSFERSTNDLGEFRLFGLPPGTYYLAVSPSITPGARVTTDAEVRWALQPPGAARGQAPDPAPVAGYTRVYFPGTPDPGAATPIVVGPGEVREGLEFTADLIPVARLEGTVRRPDGSPAAGTRMMLDVRVPRVSLEGSTRSVAADAGGRFVFTNVAPDNYRISARAASAAPAVLDLWAHTDVVVSGADVSGIGLTLAPASVMTGRLAFVPTSVAPPKDLSSVRLQFLGVAALAQVLVGGSSFYTQHTATVDADGAFRVVGLPPDRYLATATWTGMRSGDAGWWLTTMRVGGRDLGDSPLVVNPNEDVADVVVEFRDRIGTIEGTLTDATGRPAPEYFVIAFPAERASWTTTSKRTVPPVQPATDGRFRVTGLLPGEYYLAVVTEIEPDEATDPRFLETLVSMALRVTIGEGETRRQNLRIGGR
jgi:protocatechuate 3,4-dioxygenase beta subunit